MRGLARGRRQKGLDRQGPVEIQMPPSDRVVDQVETKSSLGENQVETKSSLGESLVETEKKQVQSVMARYEQIQFSGLIANSNV